jgi:hypothetical protein
LKVSDAKGCNSALRLSTESGNSCRYKIDLELAKKSIKIYGMAHTEYINILKNEIEDLEVPAETIFNYK